jgi:autotransporter-associated beta strand protein
VNLNGGSLVANGTFALDNAGANLRSVNLLANGGGLAAVAGNTLTVDGLVGSAAGAGPLTIGLPPSSANNFTAGLLPGTGTGTANPTPVYATGTVMLTNANSYTGGTVLQSGTLNINGSYALGGANYGGLTFNGGTLQYAVNFPGNNGTADLTSAGGTGMTLAAGGGAIDLNGNTVTYAGAFGNGGSGALVVKSSLAGGVLNLNGANNYSGATTVTNATLSANNASGSATGSGNVLVQNQGVLAGPGAVGGAVTVASGGTLAPGGFSVFDIGRDLTLAAGASTTLAVQHSPLNNTVVNVTGTLTEGGVLTVTNTGTSALTNGDSFQLFNAGNFTGAFSAVSLPALATNLVWNTNTLAAEGLLSVVALAPPTIANIQIAGNDLTIIAAAGADSWRCVILSATNLVAPQWTPVVTNQFDARGNFSLTLTNAVNPGQTQTFYRLQLQ